MDTIGFFLISAGIAMYGIIPLAPDLGSTHAKNPKWPPHARFHVVSQVLTTSLIAVVAMVLVWIPSDSAQANFNLAVVLSACVIGPFFLSGHYWSKMYQGALETEELETKKRKIDGNQIVFGGAGILVLVGRVFLLTY